MRRRALPVLIALAPLVAACGGESAYPTRDCATKIWVTPAHRDAAVHVIGSWDDWSSPGQVASSWDDGVHRFATLDLPAGEYGYLIVEDGKTSLDRSQPLTTFRGEDEVSLLIASDCSLPEIRVDRVTASDDGELSI